MANKLEWPEPLIGEGGWMRWGNVIKHLMYQPLDDKDKAATLRWLRKQNIRERPWRCVEAFLRDRLSDWLYACRDAEERGEPDPPRERLSDLLKREWEHAVVYVKPVSPEWLALCRKRREALRACKDSPRQT